MNAKDLEENTAAYLRFRVTPVGNRKIEFLHFYGEGADRMLRVTSTRPATNQEQALWDHMMGLREQLDKMGWTPDGGVPAQKEYLPGGGVDANTVRDPLGNRD